VKVRLTIFLFLMVFIGNPRRGTNRGGGDRIILRSMQSFLKLIPCLFLVGYDDALDVKIKHGVYFRMLVHIGPRTMHSQLSH